MNVHPVADMFPLLGEADLAALAQDIRVNGLLEPITTLDGLILDGRNRYRACVMAAVEPRFEVFDGPDPLSWVVSRSRSLQAEAA